MPRRSRHMACEEGSGSSIGLLLPSEGSGTAAAARAVGRWQREQAGDARRRWPGRLAALRHPIKEGPQLQFRDGMDAPELGDGMAMLVGAQVQPCIVLDMEDFEGSRLFAALIAACGLPGFERKQQP